METTGISYKGLVAIIDAIEFRISSYEHQLTSPELNDDDAGDIQNDIAFLGELLSDFNAKLISLIANNLGKNSD